MEQRYLGKTGLKVTRLCFGTLPMGPMEANQPLAAGIDLLKHALDQGINFIDTAKGYRTYPYIKGAIKNHPAVIISTKTPSLTFKDAAQDVEQALAELDRSVIDIFLLHAARDQEPFPARQGALEALKEYKKKGKIRAIGLSTHYISVVRMAAEHKDIEVIHPLINRTGMGILDGTSAEMIKAIAAAHEHDKGIFAMKPLAGGNLLKDYAASMQFVLDIPQMDSIATGMLHKAEVDQNIACFNGQTIAQKDVHWNDKNLLILGFCKGCGKCVEACPNFALTLVDKKSRVDKSKCLLCGYCTPECPMFAIRLI
jgi:aryl-alcohol dehydrogenase-like predicted oxidoreductase/NAD-dependent dihydropyrimidine dehydrogenase PreA subunit